MPDDGLNGMASSAHRQHSLGPSSLPMGETLNPSKKLGSGSLRAVVSLTLASLVLYPSDQATAAKLRAVQQ